MLVLYSFVTVLWQTTRVPRASGFPFSGFLPWIQRMFSRTYESCGVTLTRGSNELDDITHAHRYVTTPTAPTRCIHTSYIGLSRCVTLMTIFCASTWCLARSSGHIMRFKGEFEYLTLLADCLNDWQLIGDFFPALPSAMVRCLIDLNTAVTEPHLYFDSLFHTLPFLCTMYSSFSYYLRSMRYRTSTCP